MNASLVFLFLCIGASLAVVAGQEFNFKNNEKPREMPQLYGGGGGNRKDGVNVNLDARFPIYKSPNERHEVHGTVGHSQHLGGPYGSSKPDHRGGLQYTYRF